MAENSMEKDLEMLKQGKPILDKGDDKNGFVKVNEDAESTGFIRSNHSLDVEGKWGKNRLSEYLII